jgi:low temperature requirement protein LtrA
MAPWALFWTPGLGRSTTNDWDVDGHHMAERCGLFIIIALGESILVTGATFAKADWTLPVTVAFVASFLASVAMWWIYFSIGAERGTHFIAASKDPGSVARLAYTYLHIPIVGGIIVLAASDEFVLAHPSGHADPKTVIATLGGVGLFLLGNLLFKRATAGWYQLSHLVGLALVAAAVPVAGHLSPAALSVLAAGILVTVAIWETRSLRPRG